MLVRVGKAEELPDSGASPSPLSPFPEQATVDLKVGRMGLGYERSEERVLLFAYGIEEEESQEKEPAVVCRASVGQCRDLITGIEAILAAGRRSDSESSVARSPLLADEGGIGPFAS